jgi:hypothetical protein
MTEEQLDNLRHLIKQEIEQPKSTAWNMVSGAGQRNN